MPACREPEAAPSSYTALMELRDGELVLRLWVEDDVPAVVSGSNDPEVALQLGAEPDSTASR